MVDTERAEENTAPPEETVDLGQMTDLATPWCVRVAATLRIADSARGGTALGKHGLHQMVTV